MMAEFIEVRTTFQARSDAASTARELVGARLAACAQIRGPIESTYAWKGAVEQQEEWLLAAKVRSDSFEAVSEAILRQHPYDTPEIVAVPYVAVEPRYEAWMRDETAAS